MLESAVTTVVVTVECTVKTPCIPARCKTVVGLCAAKKATALYMLPAWFLTFCISTNIERNLLKQNLLLFFHTV